MPLSPTWPQVTSLISCSVLTPAKYISINSGLEPIILAKASLIKGVETVQNLTKL